MGDLFAGNDFFSGGIALMLIGAVIAAIRYAPVLVWNIVQRNWAVSITTRDRNLIRWIGVWISQSEYGERCQWLDAITVHHANGIEAVIWPGEGIHSFVYDGTRFWIEHTLEDRGVSGVMQRLTMRILGRDSTPLRKIIYMATEMANREQIGKNVILMNDKYGNWERIRLFPVRPLESLFLKRGLIDEILQDASKFFEGGEWYTERGLPRRRGYLFWGPAGNGKSTIIQVIASRFELPIYLLTLSDSEMTDHGLARALGQMPDKCLLVIEDFEKINLEGTELTMSGILNSIDGPLASEGRLLIITANEVNKISDYFLRPGRIDRKWCIDFPDTWTVEQCLDKFGVDGKFSEYETERFMFEALDEKWSMAQVQQEIRMKLAN